MIRVREPRQPRGFGNVTARPPKVSHVRSLTSFPAMTFVLRVKLVTITGNAVRRVQYDALVQSLGPSEPVFKTLATVV